MRIKKKIIKFLLLALIVVIPFCYYSNQLKLHHALNAVIELDRAKNKALYTEGEVDYERYVDNDHLIDYYKLRDRYNTLWASNNAFSKTSIVGYSNQKGIILFNRCYVFFTSESNIIDTLEPLQDKTVSYNRFVVLRAKHGKWYITKDIWAFRDKVSIRSIFDSSYLDKKITQYEEYIKRLNK